MLHCNITETTLMALLVTLTEIEVYLPSDLASMLRSTPLFDEYEQTAAHLVERRGGITLPTSATARPSDLDWTVEVMAAIIAWRLTPKLGNPNQDVIRLHERHYALALERLDERRQVAPTSTGRSMYGQIEDMY